MDHFFFISSVSQIFSSTNPMTIVGIIISLFLFGGTFALFAYVLLNEKRSKLNDVICGLIYLFTFIVFFLSILLNL